MPLRPVLLLLSSLPLRNCIDGCESSLLQKRSSHAQGVQCPGLKQPVSRAEAPRAFDSWETSNSLYVNEDDNFAFCLIPKNAVSQWTKLMTRLEYLTLDVQHAYYEIAEDGWAADKAWNVFSNKAAVRAVFLRDPLERFLSAFLNKCTDTCNSGFCLGAGPVKNMSSSSPVSFREAVRTVKSLGPKGVINLDTHWKPQAYHCDLHERIHEYTDVGLMQLGNLAESAGCLLEKAGLQWLNVDDKNHSKPFWQVANKFVEHDTANLLKQYYTPEAAATVMQAYKADYDLLDELQFPRPQWIQEATGEKMDERKCGGGRKEGIE